MAGRSPVPYRWAGEALLRATTDPGGLDVPDDLGQPDDNAATAGLAWLSTMWQREDVRAALTHASPVLSRQVGALLAAGNGESRTVRRAALSVASYLLRWQHRPTPFGLFAGVGPARIGAVAKVRWGTGHDAMVRADAGWLGDVVARLHDCRPLLDRLHVTANDVGQVRGDRFVAAGRAPDWPAQELAPVEVSIRHSRPVRAALAAARSRVGFAALHALLAREFPAAGDGKIDGLLAGLLDEGLLISNLTAPMTCLDALGHICAELDAVDARTIVEIEQLVRELSAIHHELTTGNRVTRPGVAVVDQMKALSAAATVPLVIDTILDCDVQVPEQIAREAADAVGVLLRLSPYPFGYPVWRDYHARFRARYGTGALVPVLELVADSGLGFPAEYLGSAHGGAARQVSERDEKLLALIQRATVDGTGEVVLTDDVINDLTAGDRTELVHLPPRLEVAVEVHAVSVDALARGRFGLVVTGTPRPGSSMAGRHAHLLPADGREQIAGTFAVAEPGAIAAQLSFAPRKRRNENVARTEQLLPDVISLAEHRRPDKHVIRLSDLAVTVDESRFHLVQLSTGRRVETRVTHALEAGVHTPPLARFLAEIPTARDAVYKAFHFGAAARLPHLPRIRYRRTVLSAARWLLAIDDLSCRSATTAEWEAALTSWRARWRVPERVALVSHDRRQPLDLTRRPHRLILRTRLERTGRVELRETAAPEDLAWLGRAHELLIPLASDDSIAKAPTPVTGQPVVVARDAIHPPGNSTILCAQIYGHPGRFDEILTERLPGLIDSFADDLCGWWFGRHRQMRRPEVDQYLILYLRLPGQSGYGPAATRLADWSTGLCHDRLLSQLALISHEPQPGRYGHGPALDRAYDVFAADSAAALAQIRAATHLGLDPQAVSAAGMVDLAVSFAGSVSAGLDWLVHGLSREHGPLDRALRDQALQLADPDGAYPALHSTARGRQVVASWKARARALAAYRQALSEQRDALTVLPALLHSHHVRAVGVDPVVERMTGRLARTCALRHIARVGSAK